MTCTCTCAMSQGLLLVAKRMNSIVVNCDIAYALPTLRSNQVVFVSRYFWR